MKLVVRRMEQANRPNLTAVPLVLALENGPHLPNQTSLRVVSEVGEPVKIVVELLVDGDGIRIEGDAPKAA